MNNKARILIVDDYPLVREGLMQLIHRQDDLCCCGTADGLDSALKAVASQKPDLITVDIRLPKGDGLTLIKDLKAHGHAVPVLVISQFEEMLYAQRALKAGAQGYLMKDRATEDVLTAIRTILSGGFYVSPQIAVLAFDKRNAHPPDKTLHALSDRELEVLQLLGAGLGTRNIADRLGLSVKTIEAHREHIKEKLGLTCAAELLRLATDYVKGQAHQHMPRTSASS
jgi:DNA-binding NarL/FixJ family response regulator